MTKKIVYKLKKWFKKDSVSKKLKACPFCGGDAKIRFGVGSQETWVLVCECEECYATIPAIQIKRRTMENLEECTGELIEKWNRRAADEQ